MSSQATLLWEAMSASLSPTLTLWSDAFSKIFPISSLGRRELNELAVLVEFHRDDRDFAFFQAVA